MKKLLFIVLLSALSGLSYGFMQVMVTDERDRSVYDYSVEPDSASKDITGSLKYFPELSVVKRSFSEVQSELVISGGTFEQTGIMLDGIKIKDPQTGHYGFDLTVPMPLIESVKVIKSGSAEAGSGSFAGLVEMKTKKASDGYTAISSYGSFGTIYNYLSASKKIEGMGFTAAVEDARSNGYRDGTDYYKDTAYLKYELADGHSISLSWSEKDYGAYDYYTPGRGFASREFIITKLVTVSSEPLSWLKLTPYYRSHYDRYTLDNARPSYYVNRHNSEMYGSEIRFRPYTDDRNNVSLKYGYHREALQSRSLGNHYRERSELYLSVFSSAIESFNINTNIGFEKRHDSLSYDLLPSAAVSYEVFEAVELKAAYAYAARYPSFTDIYYKDSVNEGNTDLKPERAHDLKAGFGIDLGAVRFSIDKTNRWGTDIIDWGDFGKRSASNKIIWQIRNIGKINTSGFNVNTAFPAAIVDMNILYSYLDAARSESYVSKYGLNFIRHKLTAAASASVFETDITVAGTYRDYTDRTRDYTGVDLTVSKKLLDWLKVTGKCENLLNRYFEDVPGIPAMGRYFELRADVNF